MQIFVAGAGSGKTTNMAKRIIELREKIDSNKTIYCVAFTNNAVNCIKNKLIEHYCFLPDNIIVSTIHSFLYKEFIRPYYYILYNKQFTEISTSKLPNDVAYKNSKIKDWKKKIFCTNLLFLKKQNGWFLRNQQIIVLLKLREKLL